MEIAVGREVQLALVAHYQGTAVDQQFAEGQQHPEPGEQQEAVVAALDLAKALQLLAGLGIQAEHRLLEPDPRVDQGDQDVRQDVADQQQQAGEQHHAHYHRVIAVENGGQAQQAETVDIEDGLDEE